MKAVAGDSSITETYVIEEGLIMHPDGCPLL
jgi:hypothetical protein